MFLFFYEGNLNLTVERRVVLIRPVFIAFDLNKKNVKSVLTIYYPFCFSYMIKEYIFNYDKTQTKLRYEKGVKHLMMKA